LQERKRGEHPLGVLAGLDWIEVLSSSVRQTLVDRTWCNAFAENGMSSSLESLRQRIADMVCVHFPLRPGPPSDWDLEMIVGRKRERLRDLVLKASLRTAARQSVLRLPNASTRAASAAASGSSGPAVPPPLPPPLLPPAADASRSRLTRSGSHY
jgi:hypothetical protein